MTSLSTVVARGDSAASLEAMRDAIAVDIDACESMRDKAALYLRLSDVIAVLEEVRPKPVRGDSVDEIAKRRVARRASATKNPARAERSS